MKPKRFDDFYGMDSLINRLSVGVAGDNTAHAYLFCGPAGTGKRSLSAICARAVHCTGEKKPCDVCDSCQRFLNGSHPDHIVLSSEKALGVSDVRALIERVAIKPYEGGMYTVVIEDCDDMTIQAQNALLKTLEEPPDYLTFFLLAKSQAPLLSTVLSRVRLVRLPALGLDNQTYALEKLGFDPKRAALLANLTQGSVGQALLLDGDESFWALRERVLQALSLLKTPGEVSKAFSLIKDDRAQLSQIFMILEQTGCAMQRAQALGIAPDPALVPKGIDLSGSALIQLCLRAKRMIKSNVSFQSVMELLMFDLINGAILEESKV